MTDHLERQSMLRDFRAELADLGRGLGFDGRLPGRDSRAFVTAAIA